MCFVLPRFLLTFVLCVVEEAVANGDDEVIAVAGVDNVILNDEADRFVVADDGVMDL